MADPGKIVELTISQEWGRVTAALVRRLGDLELAEDALQDAVEQGLRKWPREGVPKDPASWLLRVAEHKAIDHIRRISNFRSKQGQLVMLAELEEEANTLERMMDISIPDDRLSLIFTCCHPSLDQASQVSLTLKTVTGMKTREIARAFLTTERTMAQRLVRTKRKIKVAGVPYGVPGPEQWHERLSSVLSVIYFIFNEGYAATSGTDQIRSDLCSEAIRLGRILADLLPLEAEVSGLAALMLLHDARAEARSDDKGNIISLELQDRTRWNGGKINDGLIYLRSALEIDQIGTYQLQAIISASHDQALNFADTDWAQIEGAYHQLYLLNASPVLLVNKAVAMSYARGVSEGMSLLKDLESEPRLVAYQPYHAARADMLRRSGNFDQAIEAYNKAIALTDNQAERDFLSTRKEAVKATQGTSDGETQKN